MCDVPVVVNKEGMGGRASSIQGKSVFIFANSPQKDCAILVYNILDAYWERDIAADTTIVSWFGLAVKKIKKKKKKVLRVSRRTSV